MRRTILLLAILLPAMSGENVAEGRMRGADETAIRAHIDKIFQAYMHKDRETVKATHAKAWRGFLTGSRTILRGIDDYMRDADYGLKNPNGGMTAYKMVDYDVQFHRDIAIVNYIAETEGTQNGQAWTAKLRVLDIYEKQNGEWMQVASNTCLHPDMTDRK